MNAKLITLLNEGLTAAEATDYLAVRDNDYTQSQWADERGTSQQAISKNVSEAEKKLGDRDLTDVVDPAPLATIEAEGEMAVLFDDGEFTITGHGEAYCTDHGGIAHDESNIRACNHEYDEYPGPILEATDVFPAIEADRDVLMQAADRLAERYPGELAEISAPLHE